MKSRLANISFFTWIVLFLCLSLIGIALVPQLPVKLSPTKEMPTLTISFSMRNASARIIEAEVTSRLEGMLSRVRGVSRINSVSDDGSGRITVRLDKHADIDAVRFEISTLVRQMWPQLPETVSYPLVSARYSESRSSRPFMVYTLNAPAAPAYILQYAEDNIVPAVGRLLGVSKVELTGATPMEWTLNYDRERLSHLDVSVSDIQRALSGRVEKEELGICHLENNEEESWIRVVLMTDEPDSDFAPEAVKVQSSDGRIFPLSSLVRISRQEAEPTSYYRINGLNSIYLNITSEKRVNQLLLKEDIMQVLAQVQEKFPVGYELHKSYDATDYINEELQRIYFRTGLTVLILLLFVFLITRNVRYLLLITVSLAVNISVAVIFYYLFDLEIQLYSLAGITISLNLVIDNTIVMTDHYLRRKDLKTFLSILAATLTTVGALSILFFMDEKVRLNLQDFAAVIIINLLISLFVALFFVPSVIEKIALVRSRGYSGRGAKRKRMTIRFTRFYGKTIVFVSRYRGWVIVFIVLAFGLPVYLLPEKMKGESWGVDIYNKIFDHDTYREHIRPVVDKVLGGTLRLFTQHVGNRGSYYDRDEEGEIVLHVNATLPNGATLEQMNTLISRMEQYLTSFPEIRQFQTSVSSARRASISIYFTWEALDNGFPYFLNSDIVSKALELGGGSWSVYGLPMDSFNNDVRESAGDKVVTLYGYNYDELYAWADTLRNRLLQYRRIRDITINSEQSYWKDDYTEYYLSLDKRRMAEENVSTQQLYAALKPVFGQDISCGTVFYEGKNEKVRLVSSLGREYDIWALENIPVPLQGRSVKLSSLATITREDAPQSIRKENQQYVLVVQFTYIGSYQQGNKRLEEEVEALNEILPLGYTAEIPRRSWRGYSDDYTHVLLLLLVVAIIFFISSILFNSLKQPFLIILLIPISYIGAFLTFYLFGIRFDQGGFAAFVLLCGITVNAGIYLLNEYNAIRRRQPGLSVLSSYLKAWNTKIIPIILTIVSTILGFLPFLVGAERNDFWFSLAIGTIGGLIMSLLGLFLFLPLFMGVAKTRNLTKLSNAR